MELYDLLSDIDIEKEIEKIFDSIDIDKELNNLCNIDINKELNELFFHK